MIVRWRVIQARIFAGEVVGDYVPDLLVEDRVIVEGKAVTALEKGTIDNNASTT